MDNAALFNRAAEAGYAYRELYGSFPENIGIHFSRLKTCNPCIRFFGSPPRIRIMEEISPLNISITQHTVWFEPLAGPRIDEDEVYLIVPGQGIRSGDQILRMAKEFSHG